MKSHCNKIVRESISSKNNAKELHVLIIIYRKGYLYLVLQIYNFCFFTFNEIFVENLIQIVRDGRISKM